jgi:hypothetical protein
MYDLVLHLSHVWWFSSALPHWGMWAMFLRSRADVEGHENDRGDPWWGRSMRCVAESVLISTPAISISQTLNILWVQEFSKGRKNVISSPTCTLPHDNDQRRQKSTPPDDYSRDTLTYRVCTTANLACLRWGCWCGWCLEWQRWPYRSHENCRTCNTSSSLVFRLGYHRNTMAAWPIP